MKERPILFSGEMVRAILDGTKTMMRSVVKPQPDLSILKESYRDLEFEFRRMPVLGPTHVPSEWGFCAKYDKPNCVPIYGYECPYGTIGDRLWVKETHHVRDAGYVDGTGRDIVYKADDEDFPYGWTPSIHMPRWASRITLEITDIRVERLQDISEEDAKAEGVGAHGGWNADETEYGVNARGPFSRLWDSINAKSYPWASNPWVWVIEFRRAE
jgi:hypothetical protein